MEKFAVPGAGGILEQTINQTKYILIQDRCKEDAPDEYGLMEIPAGKIREFENIYDCLRREVKEETGLDVVEIQGEDEATIIEHGKYSVLNYTPFSSSQNLKGEYPIMVQIFLCKVQGKLETSTNETKNLRWIALPDLQQKLETDEHTFYPMHITTLKKYLSLFAEHIRKRRSSQTASLLNSNIARHKEVG